MPSVSGKQHRAMEAAAHGKSTLGIPKSVGKDFVAADKAKKKRTVRGDLEAAVAEHEAKGAG
jgi:hypothetical protein